ncbi:MAG: DUF523 domain-containing protein [Marinifilaceae bacterium]|jgi:uncharacterized protein YbbK (DUF523 family)|nr:DUF523 domain-containing protein [Marinifilaceae bacterium]
MILISSCLIGVKCRYNGECTKIEELEELFKSGKAMPICPEILGELPIPREACEIVIEEGEKKVKTAEGKDFTSEFELGAKKTLEIAKLINSKIAILKSRSPSCGKGRIYSGNHDGEIIKGNGLTAKLLINNNIKVYTENEIELLKEILDK